MIPIIDTGSLLMRFTFECQNIVGVSPLTMDDVMFTDVTGRALQLNVPPELASISQVPLPASIYLLGAGIIAALASRKRSFLKTDLAPPQAK